MPHGTPRVTRARTLALRAALLGCSLLATHVAAAQDVRVLTVPGGRPVFETADPDRRMIGITTVMESERGDTLGLRIESVTRGSPAEQAGLKAGDRLQSVNGTSLRADRADAGEDDYAGVLTRRLQRAVQAAKPGEAVTLRVLSGTTAREVRVTPVKASELAAAGPVEGPGGAWRGASDLDRAVIGLSVAPTGTVRDTLGLFVQSVVRGGPAEQAGIYEGDRIAAIGGVSLRVPREDAEDEEVAAGRAERLAREVAKLTAGQAVELTVVSAGRARTVRVTTVQARALPERGFEMRIPDGMDGLPWKLPDIMPLLPDEAGPGARERIRIYRAIPEGADADVRVLPRMRAAPGGERPMVPLSIRRSVKVDV